VRRSPARQLHALALDRRAVLQLEETYAVDLLRRCACPRGPAQQLSVETNGTVARSLCGGEQCGAARDSGHCDTAGGESILAT